MKKVIALILFCFLMALQGCFAIKVGWGLVDVDTRPVVNMQQ